MQALGLPPLERFLAFISCILPLTHCCYILVLWMGLVLADARHFPQHVTRAGLRDRNVFTQAGVKQ